MVTDQKKIYFIVGEEYKTLINSPHLEALKKRKVDVIVFHDPVDPFMLMRLTKFQDFEFLNVTSKELELPPATDENDSAKTAEETTPENINEVLTFFKSTLGDKIKEVRTTEQLVESPARLVDSDDSPSKELQMAYQYLQKDLEAPGKVLEINPRHPIIQQLSDLKGFNPIRDLVIEQIYENTLLVEGVHINTTDMVSRINKLLMAAMKKDETK
jgi:molecular chaperone HtpG